MKKFTKKLACFSFMVFCFFFILLNHSVDVYASRCTDIFDRDNNNNNKIDYELYLPSVVRIYSTGYSVITGESIVRALNYMLGDDELVDTVEPIIDRLRQIQKRKGLFDSLVNFFGSTISREQVSEKDIEILAKSIQIPQKFIVNLKDIIRVMREYNSPFGWESSSGCTGVVVSHNVLLTAAHCIFNRAFIGASLADNRYVEAISSFYPLASMASSKKFFFDVGVLVFADHTFDGISPLKVKSLFSSDYGEVYGAIGIDTDGTGENKRWGDVVILNKDNVFVSSQERSSFLPVHGNSGGPLINNKGEVVGIISGPGKNKAGNIFDLYSSLILEENYSFLQKTVRNNGININGIR